MAIPLTDKIVRSSVTVMYYVTAVAKANGFMFCSGVGIFNFRALTGTGIC